MKITNLGITGSSGTLGRILCDRLKWASKSFSCFLGDLCDKSEVNKWIYSGDLDAIIHLAAVVPVSTIKENPLKAFDTNVGGTINLLTSIASKALRKKLWFFYASSSHVYKSSCEPISEDYETLPISLYGKTKLMAEEIVHEVGMNSKYNLDVCIGRIFSFYHQSQDGNFLYPSIVSRLESEDLGLPFELYGADSVRDFLAAEQVIEIIIKLFNNRSVGIYNIASGKGTKIRDFVQSLTTTKLTIVPKGTTDFLVADISKLKKEIGI